MNALSRSVHSFCKSAALSRGVSFKSAISLETLYPNSSLKLTTPTKTSNKDTWNGYIPIKQLEITYSRSSGPGGQNVNKVNTKVDLRFHLQVRKSISVSRVTSALILVGELDI